MLNDSDNADQIDPGSLPSGMQSYQGNMQSGSCAHIQKAVLK